MSEGFTRKEKRDIVAVANAMLDDKRKDDEERGNITFGIDLARLRELAEAERENRITVHKYSNCHRCPNMAIAELKGLLERCRANPAHEFLLEDALQLAITALESPRDWTACAEGMPTNPNVACSLTVYNDDVFGEPQVVLLPWYAAYNSEIRQWVTADGVEVEEEVIAWKHVTPYRADDTTGKVKEDADGTEI